jgi:hypothetical protein
MRTRRGCWSTPTLGLLGGFANPHAAERIRPARILVQMVEPDRAMAIDVGEVVQFHRGMDDADYTGRISLPAPSVWVRLCTGRLDPAHTPCRVSSAGEHDLDDVRALCTPT